MKKRDDFIMHENFICPAFTVKDGIVDCVNEAAVRRGVNPGDRINSLIAVGSAEYAAYIDGILCLTLQIRETAYTASVSVVDDRQIFCLESDYEKSELRAFALAAQELRAPLSNALAQASQDPGTTKLNRNLHQLLRAVCNMSDAAIYTNPHCADMQLQNAVWFFREVLDKAKELVQKSGRDLEFKLPAKELHCYMDKEKVERAVYNLISNAIKFSQGNTTVYIDVEHRNDRLYFVIKNETNQPAPYASSNFFNRFIREPGLEDPRNGIGLGMSIVRSVAIMHGGTLLLESKDSSVCVTMTMDAKTSKGTSLRSPVMLPTDYAGGYDHAITEMADILSDTLYVE